MLDMTLILDIARRVFHSYTMTGPVVYVHSCTKSGFLELTVILIARSVIKFQDMAVCPVQVIRRLSHVP